MGMPPLPLQFTSGNAGVNGAGIRSANRAEKLYMDLHKLTLMLR